MSGLDVILLLIILLLAVPFGFYLRKGLMANKWFELNQSLQDARHLTNEQKVIIEELQQKNTRFSEKETALQQEFLQLTLAYKNLQERLDQKEKELLTKQYEVPPQFSHLEESNKLLSSQIDSLRTKMKKWKTKDFLVENKKLLKKLKQANTRLKLLDQENKKLGSYKSLYTKIQELNSEATKLFYDKKKIVLKKKKRKPKNIFSQQPEFRKKMIFNDIINSDKKTPEPKMKVPVFDIKSNEKGLADLADVDKTIVRLFEKNEIRTFNDLINTKISRLKSLLEEEGINTKKYPYQSWPIQASLAKRGEWNLIEEYKSKL